MDQSVKAAQDALAQAVARARETNDPADRQACKAAQKALAAVIADGALPCTTCQCAPHGMVNPAAVKGMRFDVFEIGCAHCGDKRARAMTRVDAVAAWNAGDYVPAKKAAS